MPDQTFSTPGIFYWVAPAGVTSVTAEVRAGGGGGGSNNRVGNNGGGGGGGGGYSRSVLAVSPGTNYWGNVGGGGAGGINNNNGANGGNSDFNNSQILARFGIRGLSAGTGGAVSGLGTGDVRYQGGRGPVGPRPTTPAVGERALEARRMGIARRPQPAPWDRTGAATVGTAATPSTRTETTD